MRGASFVTPLNLILTTTAALSVPRPRCSSVSGPQCSCPAGTSLQQSTTWATLAANAKDVRSIAGSFQSTDWFGTSPTSVTGQDNTINCTRTLTTVLPEGPVSISERLFGYRAYEDGSFTLVYDIGNAPVVYTGGSFWGDWDLLDVTAHGQDETSLIWTIYACFTVESDFPEFHESAINNITAILQSTGKSRGYVVPPYSQKSASIYPKLLQPIIGHQT